MQKTGGGYVTAVVRGDVAAVKAAVDAGIRGAEKVGEVVATHVIARPHTNVDTVLPLGRQDEATKAEQLDPGSRRLQGMLLGKVVGTLVATRKEPSMEGFKFLVVRQIDVGWRGDRVGM